ncbi:MAG: S41 family peptidase [Phycisphaerales bacterium]|nr:S41 family peptidase [Phycisphaerales bacterium]
MSPPRIFHRQVVWAAILTFIGLLFWRLPRSVLRDQVVYETYGALVETDALVRREYVQPVADDRLVEGAIQGMLRRLDPYSSYIAPGEEEGLRRRTLGEYVGIGIELGFGPRGWTVIAPFHDGPAYRAGILPDDAVIAIAGHEIERLSLEAIEDLLSGEPGSAVSMKVQGPGDAEPRDVDVVRSRIAINSVVGADEGLSARAASLLREHSDVAYLRITHFHKDTGREFSRALAPLLRRGIRGLVLDVRSNPGGLMDQALAILDHFVRRGTLLSTVNRRRVVERFEASGQADAGELPLVVLIDRHSASSSEIVAGVLQALSRAVIVGERSFGKGSVQNLIPLEEGRGSVKLTVAYYRLANGRIIHRTRGNEQTDAWGVLPDQTIRSAGRAGRSADEDDPALEAAIEVLLQSTGKVSASRIPMPDADPPAPQSPAPAEATAPDPSPRS